MERKYDSRTTIFSPEGRLYQVEYAMESISNAGLAIGILSKDGIVLTAEKKSTSKLLDEKGEYEKIHKLCESSCCAVAGFTSDANTLTRYSRYYAQKYLQNYGEPIPVEQLVRRLSDAKQGYTQFGGLRPFGVSFLFAGYDKYYGFQLYQSDPSGNYSGWKATSIGANSSNVQSMLKQEYKEDMNIEDAKKLAIKALTKATDPTSIDGYKIELCTVTLDSNKQMECTIYDINQINNLLKAEGVYKSATKTNNFI